MKLHRYDPGYSLDDLQRDARRAIAQWDWSRSAHGHVLSLPAAREIDPTARYQYPNFPYADRLGECPYFRSIFESFPAPKASFRLLRRGPQSAYSLHSDRWAGPGAARFQIPIITTPGARLVLTDFESLGDVPNDLRQRLEARDVDGALEVAPGRVTAHALEAGMLYHFDTSRLHTLVNPDATDRLVLSFDLLVNDWLRERFPEVEASAKAASDPAPRWSRSALARDYGLSLLHPWRNRLQRLRGSHR